MLSFELPSQVNLASLLYDLVEFYLSMLWSLVRSQAGQIMLYTADEI